MNTVLQFPTSTGGDEVIKADCDQGYTKVANTLLDKLCEADLNGRQFKIVNAIMRKTFGFGKSEDWISYEQLAEITKIDQTNISKVVSSLIKKNVVKKSGSKLSINTIISEWVDSSNKVKNDSQKVEIDFDDKKSKTTSKKVKNDFALVKNDFQESQKRLPQKKETITKENRTKDIGAKAQKRATQFPQDFMITDSMTEWANNNQILVNLQEETEQFKDYHTAKGSTMKDWVSAWRTWMRNSKKFSKPSKQSWSQVQADKQSQQQRELDEWINGVSSTQDDGKVIEHDPF
ncbi:MAG: replication protein [Vibrio sp.]